MGRLGDSKCGNSVKKDDTGIGDRIGAIASYRKGLSRMYPGRYNFSEGCIVLSKSLSKSLSLEGEARTQGIAESCRTQPLQHLRFIGCSAADLP